MGLDFNGLSPEELLAAGSAVLTMRSLMDAARAAPHGKGMACVEAALQGQADSLKAERGKAERGTLLLPPKGRRA